jgi:hypothetical protein
MIVGEQFNSLATDSSQRRAVQLARHRQQSAASDVPVVVRHPRAREEDVPVAVELRRRSRCDDYAVTSVTASSVALGIEV